MKHIKRFFALLSILSGFTLFSYAEELHIEEALQALKVEAGKWADSVMQRLSSDERLGQIIVPIVSTDDTPKNRNIIAQCVSKYHVGGLLFSSGNLINQAQLTNYAQGLAKVPLWITLDGEWGLNMRLKDAPRFPRNMSLGCINDTLRTTSGQFLKDSLIYAYGQEVARECSLMNIQINFAPTLDINSNPKNPVIGTRSFGDTPEKVISYALPYIHGLQENGVMAVAKHFPGHGDTDTDSHKVLPIITYDRQRIMDFEAKPFRHAIAQNIGGIMVAHLSIAALDSTPNLPSSLSRPIITELLQKEMGFEGLTFTDGLAMHGVRGVADLGPKALLAGIDVLLDPVPLDQQWQSLQKAITNGSLSQSLIDEKCRKVLQYKYLTGIKNIHPIDIDSIVAAVSTPQARQLAKELYDASIVVTQNDTTPAGVPTLPFVRLDQTPFTIFNIGQKADNAFSRKVASYAPCERLSLMRTTTEGEQKQLHAKAASSRKVIVAIYDARQENVSLAHDLCKAAGRNYVLCFFTSGYNLGHYKDLLPNAAAVVLAHEDCIDSNHAAAEAMFGGIAVTGRLGINIPDIYPVGTGFSYPRLRLCEAQPEKVGMKSHILQKIDSIVGEAIENKAFPGCQILVAKDGYIIYNKGFGHHDYSNKQEVNQESIYDLASVSKGAATVPAMMATYDEKNLRLSDRISAYVPQLRHTDKSTLTIKEALFHETGMRDGFPFYQLAIDSASIKPRGLYSIRRDATFSIRQDKKLWFNKNYRYKRQLLNQEKDSAYTLQVTERMFMHHSFEDTILKKIIDLPLKRRGSYRYSCLNFCLLRHLIENVTHQPLDQYLSDRFFIPLGASSLCYNPLQSLPQEYHDRIVPTEKDNAVRRTLLRGYVHDEMAAFSGGVEGNSGLFGSAQDLVKILQMMLDNGTYAGRTYIDPSTCSLFTGIKSPRSRRGLGFDKPDLQNVDRSPTARECPGSVYGHTGYTGTCFWIDPENQLIYIFLSNRVHPHRWNTLLSEKSYRTQIQGLLYQAMSKGVKL